MASDLRTGRRVAFSAGVGSVPSLRLFGVCAGARTRAHP